MIEAFGTEAWEVRSTALCLSPVDLEGLDNDLTSSHGSGYRYLSLKAQALLDGTRSPNPHPHCGRWAFDIDGFVFVTAIPYDSTARSRGAREAREILDATLTRALNLAQANEWSAPNHSLLETRNGTRRDATRTPGAEAKVSNPTVDSNTHEALSARSRRTVTAAGVCSQSKIDASSRRDAVPTSTRHGRAKDSDRSLVAGNHQPDTRALDAALDAAHYTRLPQWTLSGELALTVSERILLADALDVMGSGSSLSYKADRARIYARTGLKASTATAALRGLCAKRLLLPVAGARGRFTVAWTELAAFARQGKEGARATGSALTESDMRRRLSDTNRSLALPVWAVQLCGATEAALVLAKAWAVGHGGGDGCLWAVGHGGGDGCLWAAGTTLSTWLPGNERSLRRARASLAQDGLAQATAQYSYSRLYNYGIARNKTVEICVTAPMIARALVVRGIDFGADLTAIAASFFNDDVSVRRDAAAWDAQRASWTYMRRVRRALAALALQGSPAALYARVMVDAGTTSRTAAPWRTSRLKALPPAA